MGLWNPNRLPDKYPVLFHQAVTNTYFQVPVLLTITETRSQADHQRKRFNAFKATLRNYPLHLTSQRSKNLVSRVEIKETFRGWEVLVWNRENSIQSLQSIVDSLPKID